MIFGPTPVAGALGAILAHTVRMEGRVLKKGMLLDEGAIAALTAAGHQEVIAARLEDGDVTENDAAHRIGEALLAPFLARTKAATGRVNIKAASPGLLVIDTALVERLNELDESLTLATLPNFTPVSAGEMLATVKIIPFAMSGAVLDVAEGVARSGRLLSVYPFRPLKVGLVLTELPGLKESIMEGAVEATEARIAGLAGTLLPPERCAHAEDAVAAALLRLQGAGAEMLLIAGASAVVDRRDAGPAAIIRAGGRIEHFGMPVDPGNLICLGRVGEIPAMVLPGCARSPKLNGFDWVLQRLFAGLHVRSKDIMRMGVGGLLKEIESRPLPREAAARSLAGTAAPRRPRQVAALVLAAGRSSRMAPLNKLLVEDRAGVPMVARVADNVLASHARPVVVVSGHEHAAVGAALAGRPVAVVRAEAYADGLSASLKAGLAALPTDAEGVIVCLGDMPLVTGAMMDRLLAAFDPEEGRAIVIPTFGGRQGNPVLWPRELLPEMMALSGDAGARHLIGRHAERVVEVEMGDDAVLRDFDTADALQQVPDFARKG
ncbi:MAG: 4-diphosphocytidyl-2C-methyl-D-erythritol kinase [Roseomonas sp.]|nr:4-diphosphocytidyl-2C-methyl-D-erythritol kinase [Roseomonas sp.]